MLTRWSSSTVHDWEQVRGLSIRESWDKMAAPWVQRKPNASESVHGRMSPSQQTQRNSIFWMDLLAVAEGPEHKIHQGLGCTRMDGHPHLTQVKVPLHCSWSMGSLSLDCNVPHIKWNWHIKPWTNIYDYWEFGLCFIQWLRTHNHHHNTCNSADVQACDSSSKVQILQNRAVILMITRTYLCCRVIQYMLGKWKYILWMSTGIWNVVVHGRVSIWQFITCVKWDMVLISGGTTILIFHCLQIGSTTYM